MHWENRIRGENNIPLRINYGIGNDGSIIGINLNSQGHSLNFSQQQTIPSVQYQNKIVNNVIQVVPVATTSTIVIPYQY